MISSPPVRCAKAEGAHGSNRRKAPGIALILRAILVIACTQSSRAASANVATIRVCSTGAGDVSPTGGKLAKGSEQVFVASPAPGFVFRNWTNADGTLIAQGGEQAALAYTVVEEATLCANFIPNPFKRFVGKADTLLRSYEFDPANGQPLATSRGRAAIALTKRGAYSGKLVFDGETFLITGALNGYGWSRFSLSRSNGTPLNVELRLRLDDPSGVFVVAVYDDLNCALSSVSMVPAPPLARRYTALVTPQAGGGGGAGFATLVRDLNGIYRGVGTLADGTHFSFGSRMLVDHFAGVPSLSLYVPSGQGGGILSGLLAFHAPGATDDDLSGSLSWSDAPTAASSGAGFGTTSSTNRVFVSPDGADANSGTHDEPLATLQAALAKIGGEGEIVMRTGKYEGTKLDLATARNVTIRSESGHTAQVYFGERLPGSAFTYHAGNVWKAPAQSSVPPQGTEDRYWVFELGTPNGAIARDDLRPQQRERIYRLDHFRLVQASSIEDVDSANGRYFLSGGMLYLRTSNGLPPAPDQEFRIPSQLPQESVVFGATRDTHITLKGIETYFALNGADFSGAGSYVAKGCKFACSGNSGIVSTDVPFGIEEGCEYAANANDGSSPGSGRELDRVTVLDVWSHDNGDEGHSLHELCRGNYLGGLYEFNTNGGITPAIGASILLEGCYTRGNLSGIVMAVEPSVNAMISGWTSNDDFDGFEQWTGGLGTIIDSAVINPKRYTFVGITRNAQMQAVNTEIRGGQGVAAGAGWPNFVVSTGRYLARWNTQPAGAVTFNLSGSRFRPHQLK